MEKQLGDNLTRGTAFPRNDGGGHFRKGIRRKFSQNARAFCGGPRVLWLECERPSAPVLVCFNCQLRTTRKSLGREAAEGQAALWVHL